MRADGFTFSEMLIALALLALFTATGYDSVRAMVRRFEQSRQDDQESGELDAAMTLMARDLRAAFVAADHPNLLFVGRVDGKFTQCDFVRTSSTEGADFHEVGYGVKFNKNRMRWELSRRFSTEVDQDVTDGGGRSYLCDVSVMEMTFFDGEAWRNEWGWNAERQEPSRGIRGLPAMVGLRLVTAGGSEIRRAFPVMVPLMNRSLASP